MPLLGRPGDSSAPRDRWRAAKQGHTALAGQPSPELKRRIEQLVEQMETTPSANQLRAIRAVEALELAGTTEALRLLEELGRVW